MSWFWPDFVELTAGEFDWVLNGSLGTVKLGERTKPSTISGVGQLYTKSDHNFYFLSQSGVETQINGAQLPSQIGQSGKFLTTDGTNLSWGVIVGSGTVTTVSVVTANGVSGSVATATTTPAITLTLGAITPTTVNGATITTATGTLTLSTFTLTVAGTASVSGTNTGDQSIFASFIVATQTTVTTASTSQALTLVGAGGLTITTDNTTKTITLTQAGGGGGTVTATGGALTASAVVLGAGLVDTKVSTGITTDGTAKLILGVNTTTIGTLKMFGNTSGDVTITPTAVAGTATVMTLQAITGTIYSTGGTDVAVADGGTGLSAIAGLSLIVANSANTYIALTPAAGQSIRINAGNTAWEAYTPTVGTVTSVGIATANGVSGSGAITTSGNITITLGAITPTSIGSATVGTTQSPFDNSTKLATTAYVDAATISLDSKPAVAYASTSALPANTYANGTLGVGATLTGSANGPLVIDSVTILVGQVGERVLVAGEAAPANDGWYTITQQGVVAVSPYILTRATESDQAAEIGAGYLTSVIAPNTVTPGTANNGKVFISIAADPFTVGTASLTFSMVGGTYTNGNGLSLTGSTFSINTAVTVDLTTSQALTNKTYNGNTFTAGTGVLTIAAAKTLTISNTLTLTATDSSTLAIGTGGTLGTAAYTAATAYATSAQGTLATNAMPIGGGTFTGNVLFTDNTLDIGASGLTRPRTGYFGTSVVTPAISMTGQLTNTLAIGTAPFVITSTTKVANLYVDRAALADAVAIGTITGAGTGVLTALAINIGTAGAVVLNSVTTLSSLVTHGTITSGGLGTGATIAGVTMSLGSDAVGDIYTAGTSNVLNRIAAVATGQVLISQGTTTKPIWSATPTITGTNITGVPAASVLAGSLGSGAFTISSQLTALQIITTDNAITASGNAATVPITSRHHTVTNNSAATLTITITTTSAVNGQLVLIKVLPSSAVAQTLAWVNTEDSTVTSPVLTGASTTLPITVGFQYNSLTSKWRTIASC